MGNLNKGSSGLIKFFLLSNRIGLSKSYSIFFVLFVVISLANYSPRWPISPLILEIASIRVLSTVASKTEPLLA